MSDDVFRPLTTESEWSAALSKSEQQPVLIFKHSARCSLSARAHEDLERLANEEDLPIYKLVVQKSRPLSNEIADTLGIRHETPQAILLSSRRPVFDASHLDVTTETLTTALQQATDAAG